MGERWKLWSQVGGVCQIQYAKNTRHSVPFWILAILCSIKHIASTREDRQMTEATDTNRKTNMSLCASVVSMARKQFTLWCDRAYSTRFIYGCVCCRFEKWLVPLQNDNAKPRTWVSLFNLQDLFDQMEQSTRQCEWEKMWNLFYPFDIWICFKWASKRAVQKISYRMKTYPVSAECIRNRLHFTSAFLHVMPFFFASWKCIRRWHLILCTLVDRSLQRAGKALTFMLIHVTR